MTDLSVLDHVCVLLLISNDEVIDAIPLHRGTHESCLAYRASLRGLELNYIRDRPVDAATVQIFPGPVWEALIAPDPEADPPN